MQKQSGFTIIELMMTILVLSILTAMAFPSFKQMMERNQVVTMANDLLGDILLARSEAIKRESQVVIRRWGNPWHKKGWRVFDDSHNTNDRCQFRWNQDDLILDRYDAKFQENHDGISIIGYGNAGYCLIYSPRGRGFGHRKRDLRTAQDYIEISKGDTKRYICFSPTGRPRVEEQPCS